MNCALGVLEGQIKPGSEEKLGTHGAGRCQGTCGHAENLLKPSFPHSHAMVLRRFFSEEKFRTTHKIQRCCFEEFWLQVGLNCLLLARFR